MAVIRPRRFGPSRLPESLRLNPEGQRHTRAGVEQARRVARELLMRHLDPHQLNRLALMGTFEVRGSNGGRYLMSSEGSVQGYCVHAFGYNGEYAYYVPEDCALAILLTLRTDEAAFLDAAVPYPFGGPF